MKSIINKPWGSYTVIENGKDYVVKKLIIKTNEKTSLQSHDYRSEHWIIVQGIAEVTINKETKTIRANENIFIPTKAKHRIANQHNEDLVIIEIWYGKTLDEKDIIRYDDKYNRITE